MAFDVVTAMPRSAPVPESLAEIGVRLRRTRESTGLNQATFCKLTGIGQQAWNNYERGFRRINVDDAVKVCRHTGVSLDWIYRGITAGLPVDLALRIQGR